MASGARTRVRRKLRLVVVTIVIAGGFAVLAAFAAAPQIASLVIGQSDFYKNAPNYVDGAAMAAPRAVAIDNSLSPNHVWVADTGNNRVLGWNDESTYLSGAAADIVIGQVDFLSSAENQGGAPGATTLYAPAGVAIDSAGNLYVGDSGNNRVMVFSDPLAGYAGTPFGGVAAAAVFGQGGDFATNTGCGATPVSAATLCQPEGVAIDGAGNLFVADAGDNRVTVYYAPFAKEGAGISQPANTSANLIIGQTSSSGSECNQGGASATVATLCFAVGGAPFGGVGVAVDGTGNLFVADTGNNRALEYTGPYGVSKADSTTANLVFSGNGLEDPAGVAIDGSGNFYLSSNLSNQIFIYESAVALSNDQTPNYTIGPGANNPNASSLSQPDGLAIDAAGDLYAADTANNRVLEYIEGALPSTTTASRELGQPDLAHNEINRIDGAGLEAPGGVAASGSGAQAAVYVADSANNRVLGWISPAAPSSGSAEIVIGQSDFSSSSPNAGTAEGAATLNAPAGAATDSSGNLFVADTGNNRVLEFADPAAACAPYPCVDSASAVRVFGTCGSFLENGCAPNTVSASTLLGPTAVAFDPAGDLFISDTGDSRVLEFTPPFGAAPAAIRVFGQGASFSGYQPNMGGGASALTLYAPGGIAADSAGDLFVADTENNRALEFPAPFPSPSAAPSASVVFGQDGSFTSNLANPGGGASASTLNAPAAVALDFEGDLYIADTANNRVLEFNPPYSAAPSASAVFGQSGFTATDANGGVATGDLNGLGPDSLYAPGALGLDGANNLYAADTRNNRVLMYADPAPTPSATPTATPSPTASATATPTSTPTATPTATATASATATPTATPSATPTPTPVAQRLTIKPRRLNFGRVRVGTIRARHVTLINKKSKRGVAMVIEGVDPPPPGFTIDNQCPRALAPGARCTIGVSFAPQAPGRALGAIAIEDNADSAPQSVGLAGVGK
ncbi:MAG TPA: choice-of-anchor D domain-containing protein [Candidatus Binataceae bacterium]|nr:choice-of-anchor D domain-containing protein [Candidatus Binataceae bacterium]